jgi:transporter family protein
MTWIIFALLSALFAALVAIFGKMGLQHVDPTLATTVRAAIMALFLIVVSLLFGKVTISALASFSQRDWMWISLAGVAGALSWLCYFLALKYGDASAVAALDRLSVVFVIILAALLLGEAWTWGNVLGALLITLGALLVLFF